jgi:hypothetical protein
MDPKLREKMMEMMLNQEQRVNPTASAPTYDAGQMQGRENQMASLMDQLQMGQGRVENAGLLGTPDGMDMGAIDNIIERDRTPDGMDMTAINRVIQEDKDLQRAQEIEAVARAEEMQKYATAGLGNETPQQGYKDMSQAVDMNGIKGLMHSNPRQQQQVQPGGQPVMNQYLRSLMGG